MLQPVCHHHLYTWPPPVYLYQHHGRGQEGQKNGQKDRHQLATVHTIRFMLRMATGWHCLACSQHPGRLPVTIQLSPHTPVSYHIHTCFWKALMRGLGLQRSHWTSLQCRMALACCCAIMAILAFFYPRSCAWRNLYLALHYARTTPASRTAASLISTGFVRWYWHLAVALCKPHRLRAGFVSGIFHDIFTAIFVTNTHDAQATYAVAPGLRPAALEHCLLPIPTPCALGRVCVARLAYADLTARDTTRLSGGSYLLFAVGLLHYSGDYARTPGTSAAVRGSWFTTKFVRAAQLPTYYDRQRRRLRRTIRMPPLPAYA